MQAIAPPNLSFSLLLPLLYKPKLKKNFQKNSGKYFWECTRLKPLFFRTIADNLCLQILI